MSNACVACTEPVEPVELAMTNPSVGPIHTSCVHARARAAQSNNRCRCGGARRPGEVLAPFGRRGRRWIPCLRCLGTIRQVG